MHLLQVILDTIAYGSDIKKTPVVVGNCTGFAVNRVFFPYTQAACMLVDLGLDPYMIDMIILKSFGMPMGPFRFGSRYFREVRAFSKCQQKRAQEIESHLSTVCNLLDY